MCTGGTFFPTFPPSHLPTTNQLLLGRQHRHPVFAQSRTHSLSPCIERRRFSHRRRELRLHFGSLLHECIARHLPNDDDGALHGSDAAEDVNICSRCAAAAATTTPSSAATAAAAECAATTSTLRCGGVHRLER